ncbi:hypothetical protein [Pseudoflavonifractor phocaeensis]|uniref:hypothetical protein n=1 Tax=Pseudoflavonifractor phocaeensis TaxID=1870988 RepID=UPI00210F0000|nr:hypothetical protein [Pseudoflavonifractor phocaeensis]MCQ4866162.1 hypothetical protein [Pseudoflavonifractor phocaeensis]
MKRILIILISAVVLSCTAFAAEPPKLSQALEGAEEQAVYPVEVRETDAGGYRRLERVYILQAGDDPAVIPMNDFTREGYQFSLLDMLREDQTETETKEHTELITLSSDSKDMGKILELLENTREITTQDGFSGLLALDTKSISVEASGYQSKSSTVSASRTYPSLSDADVALIPKTVQDSGRTLELAGVDWQTGADGHFTALATYAGTAKSSYATGYTVTAQYTGQLSKTTNDTVKYTAVFTGAAPQELEEPQGPVLPAAGQFYGLLLVVLLALLIVGGGIAFRMEHRRRGGAK